MRYTRMIRPLLALMFCTTVPVVGQTMLTLDVCTSQAKANYPMIKQYELLEKSTEYTISNANKAYLPQFSITGIGGYIINGLPSFSLPGVAPKEAEKMQLIALAQINQTIWDGGATRASKDITRSQTEVDKASLDVMMIGIEERVNQLYFGILVVDEQVRNLDIAEDNLKLNLNRLKLSNVNGIALSTDVDEIEAELLVVEQRKIEFRFTRAAYVDMLAFMTAQQLTKEIPLKKPEITELALSSVSNRPELNLYAKQQKLVESQSAVHKVALMPTVGLLGAGVWISPGMQFATSSITSLALAGLSVSWKTSGLYRNHNERQLDEVRINRINNERAAFVYSNTLELKQYSSEVEKQRAILENDSRIVDLKAKIHAAFQLKYENGLCSTADLINALNKAQEARSNKQLHEIQLLKSYYAYKTASGN